MKTLKALSRASVMDSDAMKASRLIDAKRQSIWRGVARCEKEHEEMQERRREAKEMEDFMIEPPPPLPVRPRRAIAQSD